MTRARTGSAGDETAPAVVGAVGHHSPEARVVKVCGLVSPSELDLAASAGASLAGVWWGVPGTTRSLDSDGLRLMATSAPIERCLVTFSSDAEAISDARDSLDAQWVQLHALQPPSIVAEVRRRLPADTRLVKVLHLDGEVLLELRFLAAFDRSGVDGYILDTVSGRRIGSTGVRSRPETVERIGGQLEHPFLIAGGIDADRAADFRHVRGLPGWHGIDVDTNARSADGELDAARIETIVRAWGHSAGAGGPLAARISA